MMGRCLLASALVALLIASGSALATNPGVETYKNYTPEQIRAIPDAERQRSVPMMYIFAAQKGLAVDAHLAITMDLSMLMYPGVSDYANAIKMFQKDIGEAPTGTLTVSQIHTLTVRAEFQRLGPISFPTPYRSHLAADTASVAGTMKILDERIAWPVNYAVLSCYRRERYCDRWTTQLTLPSEDDWVRMYHLQEASRDLFKITRWENQMIEAVPYDESKCRVSSLSLNFQTEEFFEITRNAGGDCDVLGVKLPKLDKPRIAQLVNGKETIQQELSALQKTAYGYLSSAFRAQVEQATGDISKKH